MRCDRPVPRRRTGDAHSEPAESVKVGADVIDDLLCPRGFWAIDSTVTSWSSEYEIERLHHDSG